MCESNKYVHLRFLAVSLPTCMFHIKFNDSHTGRTAALKTDLTQCFPHMTIPAFFGDDEGTSFLMTWTSSFNPEPTPLSSFLLYEGWRVRNQISGVANEGLSVRFALHPTYTLSQHVNILHAVNTRQSW